MAATRGYPPRTGRGIWKRRFLIRNMVLPPRRPSALGIGPMPAGGVPPDALAGRFAAHAGRAWNPVPAERSDADAGLSGVAASVQLCGTDNLPSWSALFTLPSTSPCPPPVTGAAIPTVTSGAVRLAAALLTVWSSARRSPVPKFPA
jgi:hypothetical protein